MPTSAPKPTPAPQRPLKALFLMGPTAAGKSAFALDLLDTGVPCELISVDSALIYRGLDIGTDKPPLELRKRIPHHLIDIRDPSESYSAAAFRADACKLTDGILARGKLPLFVGGSGLYFRALEQGLSELPGDDPGIRSELQTQLEREGLSALRAELLRIDPASAQRIHEHDTQRTLRALEVWRSAGIPMSALLNKARSDPLACGIVKCALLPGERSTLHKAIERRFDAMLAAGFLDEVRRLRSRGDLHPQLPAMRLVGYRQAWAYLDGECDFAAMRLKAIAATRQLAKRQCTWLRSEGDASWHDPQDPNSLGDVLRRWQD